MASSRRRSCDSSSLNDSTGESLTQRRNLKQN
jgi:hypothetical protein